MANGSRRSNCFKRCFEKYVASDSSLDDEDYYREYYGERTPSPKRGLSPERTLGSFNFSCFKYYYVFSIIWLVLLALAGFGLIMYGVFQEDKVEYKKLNIGVGLILILCMLMFVSFLMIDTKRLRKYILHVLVPWCAGITVIVIAILVAFLVHFINFKLFLITSLPLSSLAFFTFNEIYHYIGRMRVSPLLIPQQRVKSVADDLETRRLRTSSRLLQYRPETARKSVAPSIGLPATTPQSKTPLKTSQRSPSKSPMQARKSTLPPISGSVSQISSNSPLKAKKSSEELT